MIELKSGDRVTHSIFGAGVVSTVAGSGADARITVDFASNVGRKKLLASVAHLRLQGTSGDMGADDDGAPPDWVEALDAQLRPRRGGRFERDALNATLLDECGAPPFWIGLREKLRARGHVPKMLDEPRGKISVMFCGPSNVRIRVAHESPEEARASGCAAAVLELLEATVLRDFQAFNRRLYAGLDAKLEPGGVLEIFEQNADLPDRQPLQRPKRVQPKGVIRSMPKRRDDY